MHKFVLVPNQGGLDLRRAQIYDVNLCTGDLLAFCDMWIKDFLAI